MIKLGANPCGIKLAAAAINRAYLGGTLVFGVAPASFYSWTRNVFIGDDNLNGTASVTISFNTDGSVSFTTSLGDGASLDTDLTHWHDGGTVSGIGNSRWAKKTSSGDPTGGTLASTLVAFSAAKTMSISTVGGEARQGNEVIEIYSDSGGTTKVGEINLTVTATSGAA